MQTAEAVAKDAKERRGIEPAKKRAIAVLTPTLGVVSMWWHSAMLDLLWPMNMGKAFIPTVDLKGGQVGQMRNRLVQLALMFEQQAGNELEAIMWVDDDVICSRLAMLTLAAHDRDIVSGVYMAKGEAGNEPLIFAGPSSGTMKFLPDETFEAWGWAQGLSLVKAEVYKRMVDELDLGKDEYGNPNWYKQPEFGIDANGTMTLGGTEDFHFFDNANKLGYSALIDCTKHAFGFHYDIKEKMGYPQKQWIQYLHREPIVWPATKGHKEVVWG